MFVTSLANASNDETPWQKIEGWKAIFPVELPLYCAVDWWCWGCIHSSTSTVLVWNKKV